MEQGALPLHQHRVRAAAADRRAVVRGRAPVTGRGVRIEGAVGRTRQAAVRGRRCSLLARRLQDQPLGGAGDEVRLHRVHGDAPALHQDPGLPRGRERAGDAPALQLPAQLQRRGHLPHVAVGPDGEDPMGAGSRGPPRGHREIVRNLAEVPKAHAGLPGPAADLGVPGEPDVETAPQVQPGVHGPAQERPPGVGKGPALGRHPHQEGLGPGVQRQGLRQLRHHRHVVPEAQGVGGRLPGVLAVQDRGHPAGEVPDGGGRGLRRLEAEAPLGQHHEDRLFAAKIGAHLPRSSSSKVVRRGRKGTLGRPAR